MLRAVKILIPAIVAAGCLYYLVAAFEWAEIWRVLRQIDLFAFLGAAICATVAFWILRALRWAVLLRASGWRVSFGKLYLYTAVTVGLANFAPLQIAEAIKIEIFRRAGNDARVGVQIFLIEKAFDLVSLAILATAGAWHLFGAAFGEIGLMWIVCAAILLTASAILIFNKSSAGLRRAASDLRRTNWKNRAIAFLLTAAAWWILICGWQLMFQSISIRLSPIQTTAVISLTAIAGIISLIPGAFGVTEIGTAALLSKIGYNQTVAQTGGVLIGLYSLIILILALLHWLILIAAKKFDSRFRRANLSKFNN